MSDSLTTFVGSWVRLACSDTSNAPTWTVVSGPREGDAFAGEFDSAASPFPLFTGWKPGSYVVKATLRDTDSAAETEEHFVVEVAEFRPIIGLDAESNLSTCTCSGPNESLRSIEVQYDELLALDAASSPGPEGLRHVWGRIDNRALPAMVHEEGGKAQVNPRISRRQAQASPTAFDVTLQLWARGTNRKGDATEIPSMTEVLTVTVAQAPPHDVKRLKPAEDKHWTAYRDKLHYEALATARKSATAWQGALAAVIGLLGTVTFVAGPKNITDLNQTWVKALAFVLLVAAGFTAIMSWFRFQEVADETPEYGETHPSNFDYASAFTRNVKNATRSIEKGKWWATRALVAFAIGSLLVIGDAMIGGSDADNEAGAGSSAIVVTTSDGTALCGTVDTDDQSRLTLDGAPVTDAMSITMVEECPTTTSTTEAPEG